MTRRWRRFEYQAVDADGKTQKGLIEADTARQARQQLRGMSLMPLEIGEVTSRETSGNGKNRRSKLNVHDPVADYPPAGDADQRRATGRIGLSRGFTPDTETRGQARDAGGARARTGRFCAVRGAEGISRIFDAMYCASVHAGEQSGLLDVVMERLADHMEAKQDLQRRTGQALIYPILLTWSPFRWWRPC